MRTTFALVAASLLASVHAHFTLNYPSARGAFSDDDEPTFCDGYKNVNTTRQIFPLYNGTLAMFTAHSDWEVEVALSTSANPQSLADFNTTSTGGKLQLAIPATHQKGEGVFCLPISIGNLKLEGAQDGSNVTIQVIYNGGDGLLYQCADLTLSANASTPSNSTLQCQAASNVPLASAVTIATGTTGTAQGDSTASATAPAGSSTTKGNSASGVNVPVWSGVLGLVALFAASL